MNSDSSWSRDEPITAAIEREIQARMQPNAPPISVAAQGAAVTLTGHVANQATKDALIQLARGTDGVIDVTDNLVIGGGHPFLDWLMPWRDPNKDLEQESKGEW
ncbi:MAG: BON domain-containing protein [Chloroflexota bacterium]